MEGFKRKNKEENHQELQDLDPKSSPHLEEKLTGGNVDLNLLSLFPQKVARSIGGIERSQAQENVNNGGEKSFRVGQSLGFIWGRRPLKREAKTSRWGIFARLDRGGRLCWPNGWPSSVCARPSWLAWPKTL